MSASANVAMRREPCSVQPCFDREADDSAPDNSHSGSDDDAESKFSDGAVPAFEFVLGDAEHGRGRSDEERDDRGRDAVVQPALDVEHAANTDRKPLVGDHGCTQRGVCRGKAGGDQRRQCQRKARKREQGNDSSSDDRQR